MIINLNQHCNVILTAYGAEVYNEYFRELHATCKLIELTNLKAEDELSLQLWELMNIFGKHLYNGAENCFANNDISFNDKVVKIPVYTEEEIQEMLKKDLDSAYYHHLFFGRKIYTSPWISVKDGLPSVNNNGESKMVFVRVINKHSKEEWIEQPAKYNINIKDWIAMDFTHIGKRNGIVTHWMPIPELPKEEKK